MRYARLLLIASAIVLPFSPALAPTPAAAQQASSPLPCSGNVNIVRISEIKPGMMQKFLEAVAAQKAWYKNAGLTDRIGVMRVMEQDPATKEWKLSDTEAITTHVQAASSKPPAHDEAWDAFVAMFKDSSTIKTQYLACMSAM
ncbi:MAG TPA: hypothetical protein VG714_00360 [Acidobacteriaceae bacterium]|nr:hypothetical protein [Acidobacteriaceae bacterium]